jgi:hypothetical protein
MIIINNLIFVGSSYFHFIVTINLLLINSLKYHSQIYLKDQKNMESIKVDEK